MNYKYFFILSAFLLMACTEKNNVIHLFNGIEINKKVVVIPGGKDIVFCSNENNTFRPIIVHNAGDSTNSSIERLQLPDSSIDYFIQSASVEGNYLCFIAERKSMGVFSVFLYNRESKELQELKANDHSSTSVGAFSPKAPVLAFTKGNALWFYRYNTKSFSKITVSDNTLFTAMAWSNEGRFLYLSDKNASIWRYDNDANSIQLLWQPPGKTNTVSHMITPIAGKEGDFYFISDMCSRTGFDDVYRMNYNGKLTAVLRSNEDKLLVQRNASDSFFYYRNTASGFYNLKKWKQGESIDLIKDRGVVYDYFPEQSIYLFSDHHHQPWLYQFNKKLVRPVAPLDIDSLSPESIQVTNAEGAVNLVYLPRHTPKGWIAWLHGGPKEQQSKRYNTYIANLVRNGWAVMVINYPGSTGLGNMYENDFRQPAEVFHSRASSVLRDIEQVRKNFLVSRKIHFIGVSYGSILVHEICKMHPGLAASLIDFSGIYEGSPSATRSLYIYGQYDFMLQDGARKILLEKALDIAGNKILVFDDEGHVINRRRNISRSLTAILEFLGH